MQKFSAFELFLSVCFTIVHLGSSVDFNKPTTGVVFASYVKHKEDESGIPPWTDYSIQDVVTMMSVVSNKFSRVATFGVGAENAAYNPNKTYNTSNSAVFAGEAAARLNRDRKSLVVTALLGIYQSDFDIQMDSESNLALESARVANSIFPGTVQGVIFTHWETGTVESRAEQTLNQIHLFKDRFRSLGLKIGTRQGCGTGSSKVKEIRKQIVAESDFIICEVNPAPQNLRSGPIAGFRTVGLDLLAFRTELTKVNPRIEVMGQTGWPSNGLNEWETIGNLKKYWETVDDFSEVNEFTMWLVEAFDNPWKTQIGPSDSHLGWWKLRRNADAHKSSGYAEKVFEPPELREGQTTKPEAPPTPTSVWVYIGATLGALVLIIAVTLIVFLFIRVKRLQETVTTEDIKEFIYGVSEETAAAQGGQALESALKFPYDKSYEIPKNKLKIHKDRLLGTGQFGCVYKALIEDDEGLEVALKMTKPDCPKNAMKSLLSEIKILTYLGKHANIVSIHGAYTAELIKGVVYVATELCSLGSLEGYLRSSQNTTTDHRYDNGPMWQQSEDEVERQHEAAFTPPTITYNDMVRWSHEIACGMEYLGTKHVVHADLATRNVLVACDKTAKITDFGLSRRLYDYTNYVKQQQEPLPWRWMAIESLKKLEFSSMSDVWSYGVTLWEIFSMGDVPFPGLSWNLDFVESLVNGLRMKCPPHATQEMYQIMVDCWHLEPRQRPKFADLKLSTSSLMTDDKGQVYRNL